MVAEALVLLVVAVSTALAQTGVTFHELMHNRLKEIEQDVLNGQISSFADITVIAKEFYFNQTVDHFGTQHGVNGTWFNQYFVVVDDFYKLGGPVLLFIEGEQEMKSDKYNGLLIALEHRFYGAHLFQHQTYPTESLKLLTSQQAIEDTANFIKSFPSLFPEYGLNETTKWISIGGSYPGSLSAWVIQKHPDLVFAAHASSAPVLAESNFWRYSYAVEEGMNYYARSGKCMQGWTRALWVDFGGIVTTQFASSVQYSPSYNYLIKPSNTTRGIRYLEASNATKEELLMALQTLTTTFLSSVGIQGDKDPSIITGTQPQLLIDLYATTGIFGIGKRVMTPRILWVNGQYDPWHWLSNYESSPDPLTQNNLFYLNQTHCNDLWGRQPNMTAYQYKFNDELFGVYDSWMAMTKPIVAKNVTNPESNPINQPVALKPLEIGLISGGAVVILIAGIVYYKRRQYTYSQVNVTANVVSPAVKANSGKNSTGPQILKTANQTSPV
ncbi:serine carboxypeptidase S28-domain-containing protein [Obelidium mucronatum]|nr:serine carboxypeptidase S28-domain-containing protein [Obelidium mucronatum]